VRGQGQTSDTARFAREWVVVFALVAGVALVLLGTGRTLAGALAAALCAAAVLARWRAMRRAGRNFFGGDAR
jgi:hypothetical protein